MRHRSGVEQRDDRQVAREAQLDVAVEHVDHLDGDEVAVAPRRHRQREAPSWHAHLRSRWLLHPSAFKVDKPGLERVQKACGIETRLDVCLAHEQHGRRALADLERSVDRLRCASGRPVVD